MLNKAIAKGNLPNERKDEFYQLFKYPVQAAAQMNNKLLYGQLARHGKETSKDGGAGYWAKSDAAYDSIVNLTRIYNQGYYNRGKWNRIMDFEPRKQPVFRRVPHTEATQPMVKCLNILRNGTPQMPPWAILPHGTDWATKARRLA